jgi:ribosomal protein S18 acetylase RimI-like enzyme
VQIRPITSEDLRAIDDIDGTVDSDHYLHLERIGEGLQVTFRLEPRPLRQRLIDPNRMLEPSRFFLRTVAGGMDEGLALMVELDEQPVGIVLAQEDREAGLLRVLDLRIDFDLRRQGIGTGLMLQALSAARERELRAVCVETRANNFPAAQMLGKLRFELAGVDTRRSSNHDLVQERASLIWYAPVSE